LFHVLVTWGSVASVKPCRIQDSDPWSESCETGKRRRREETLMRTAAGSSSPTLHVRVHMGATRLWTRVCAPQRWEALCLHQPNRHLVSTNKIVHSSVNVKRNIVLHD
jgi:hypothetical protein